MSRFNKYAREADAIAKAAFERYLNANSAVKDAELRVRAYPVRANSTDAEYAAKSARAQADLIEARNALYKAQHAFEDGTRELRTLREGLISALDEAYGADPSDIDANMLELLKSGILKTGEYGRMLDGALSSKNYTMARLIGKYAKEAADKLPHGDREAMQLRALELKSKEADGGELLQTFDTMIDAFRRCADNPYMIKDWDGLFAETVENF
ncbi:MAG: hypothetical protein IJG50_07545 [Clostridia bacterium]|nr:hypothetical protein [Clostridia bacterium]